MWGFFETLTVVCVQNILFGGKYFLNQQMNWLPLGRAIFTVYKNGLAHCSVGGWAAVCNYSHTCGPQVRQGWGVWLQAAHRCIPLTSQTTPNGNVLKEMGRVNRFLKNRKWVMLIKYHCRGNSLHTLVLGVGEDFRGLAFGLCREGWYSHNGFSLLYW